MELKINPDLRKSNKNKLQKPVEMSRVELFRTFYKQEQAEDVDLIFTFAFLITFFYLSDDVLPLSQCCPNFFCSSILV